VLFMLIDPRARRLMTTPGPYVAAAVALVMITPHLVWLIDNHFVPLDYLSARAQQQQGLFDHIARPAMFIGSQLFWLLPVFVIALPLLQRPREAEATTADAYDRRILALLAFGPAATVVAVSALSGRGLVSMWGYPLWLFLGPWLVVSISSRIDRTCLARLAAVWAAVTALYAASFVVDYAVLPYYDNRYRAVLFPGDRVAEEIAARFHAETGAPLAYVIGTMWLGGNIGHYAAEHPRTLIDGNPRRAPWIDLADLARRGAVVVWTDGDRKVMPAAYGAVAGNAVVQPPLLLPTRRGPRRALIGWAILPPAP
jgi:hypothetical protein